MSRVRRRDHIDLFDDPSWDSPEGRDEAATHARLAVSGFSSRTETTVVVAGVSPYLLYVATSALTLWVAMDTLDNWIDTAFRQLARAFAPRDHRELPRTSADR